VQRKRLHKSRRTDLFPFGVVPCEIAAGTMSSGAERAWRLWPQSRLNPDDSFLALRAGGPCNSENAVKYG
jgi:hypothetical protein